MFDGAATVAWDLLVYRPVHDGWRFANIGGRRALDHFAAVAGLGPGSRVLEPCCGQADGCAYLAGTYGCSVLGLEMNRRMFAEARANIAGRRARIASRVSLAQVDVCRWRTDERFDAIVVLDALMYLPDRRGQLRRFARWLRPGGHLMLAEVATGEVDDPELVGHLQEAEGVEELPHVDQQLRDLTEAGFCVLSLSDQTRQAVDCFAKISAANERHRNRLAMLGAERYTDVESNRRQLRAFRDGRLAYWWFEAIVP